MGGLLLGGRGRLTWRWQQHPSGPHLPPTSPEAVAKTPTERVPLKRVVRSNLQKWMHQTSMPQVSVASPWSLSRSWSSIRSKWTTYRRSSAVFRIRKAISNCRWRKLNCSSTSTGSLGSDGLGVDAAGPCN